MVIVFDEAAELTQGSAGDYAELWYPVTCKYDLGPDSD